jgi:hypothetical protein
VLAWHAIVVDVSQPGLASTTSNGGRYGAFREAWA